MSCLENSARAAAESAWEEAHEVLEDYGYHLTKSIEEEIIAAMAKALGVLQEKLRDAERFRVANETSMMKYQQEADRERKRAEHAEQRVAEARIALNNICLPRPTQPNDTAQVPLIDIERGREVLAALTPPPVKETP